MLRGAEDNNFGTGIRVFRNELLSIPALVQLQGRNNDWYRLGRINYENQTLGEFSVSFP